MDKKQLVIKALESLEDVWPDAAILKRWIEADIFDDTKLDILIEKLQDAIKNVKDEWTKAKLEKWLMFMKKISAMEVAERKEEESDLEDLEAMMENM